MYKKMISVLTSLFISVMPIVSVSSATYAAGETESNIDNTFVMNYDFNDNIINARLSLEDNVCICGFVATLKYDRKKYTAVSNGTKNQNAVLNVRQAKGEAIATMDMTTANLTDTSDLIEIQFECSDIPDTSDFKFQITEAYMLSDDGNNESVTYSIKENWNGLGDFPQTTASTASEQTMTTTTPATTVTSKSAITTSVAETKSQSATSVKTASSTTTAISSPDTGKDNNFVIYVIKNEEKNNVEVSFEVSGDVEFYAAEGNINISAFGLGTPVLLNAVSDVLSSYDAERNSIDFNISSSNGGNITKGQTLFTYSFPIEENDYSISCSGKFREICDNKFNDVKYSITEKNNLTPATTTSTATTTGTPTTTTNATTSTTTDTVPTKTTSTSATTVTTKANSGSSSSTASTSVTTSDTTTTGKPTTTTTTNATTSTTTDTVSTTTTSTSATTATTKANSGSSGSSGSLSSTTSTSVTASASDSSTTTIVESTTYETNVTTANDNINVTPYELSNWAANDYYKKTNIIPYRTEYSENDNGTVVINMLDGQGNVLDTYTVHLKTGKGFNNNGDEVNLPQTGNNSLSTLLIIIGSFMMIITGAFAVKKSGVIIRRKNE